MSVTTTYNFYPHKQSFGDGLAQGMLCAFGELTGLGGMYGMGGYGMGMGGYGMGSYGMGGYGMGMGASIFSSGMFNCNYAGYGMYGGCCGGANDAALGFGLTNLVLGVVGGGIIQNINDRKSAKAANAPKEKTDADYKAEAEAIIDETTTPTNYKGNITKAEKKAAQEAEANALLIKRINKYDGHTGTRTNKSRLDTKVYVREDGLYELARGEQFDIKDVKGALAAYKTALKDNDNENAKKYQKIIKAIWDNDITIGNPLNNEAGSALWGLVEQVVNQKIS